MQSSVTTIQTLSKGVSFYVDLIENKTRFNRGENNFFFFKFLFVFIITYNIYSAVLTLLTMQCLYYKQ